MMIGLENGGMKDILLFTTHEDSEHEVTKHHAGVWLGFCMCEGEFSRVIY